MIRIDLEAGTVEVDTPEGPRTHELGSAEGFEIVSRAWVRAGWDAKYVYSFTWLGRPIIQLPEDLIRLQEVVYGVRPDVIVETGVAHGGGLVFYATLLRALGGGLVVGVDVEIRPHNRSAIESHELASMIGLIEGDSVAPETLSAVRAMIPKGARVLVALDSNHTKEHARAELEAYSALVTPGSYIVAMDGIMADVAGAPRSAADWSWNNPREAAVEFVRDHPEFVVEEPAFGFNEGAVRERVTYWPGGFIRRLR